MSTRQQQQPPPPADNALSPVTLAIAALSSIVAAIIVNQFWKGGAIIGAGITPVVVTIVRESLSKPAQRIGTMRHERRARGSMARQTDDSVPVAPPPELERPDPFGIWRPDPEPWFKRLTGRRVMLGVAGGLVAFVIGGILLTGADFVFGGVTGNDRITLAPGKQKPHKKSQQQETETQTTTQPAETTPTTTQPAETTPTTTAPTETTPPPTTTTTPPPGETTPVPPSGGEQAPPDQQQVPPAGTGG